MCHLVLVQAHHVVTGLYELVNSTLLVLTNEQRNGKTQKYSMPGTPTTTSDMMACTYIDTQFIWLDLSWYPTHPKTNRRWHYVGNSSRIRVSSSGAWISYVQSYKGVRVLWRASTQQTYSKAIPANAMKVTGPLQHLHLNITKNDLQNFSLFYIGPEVSGLLCPGGGGGE